MKINCPLNLWNTITMKINEMLWKSDFAPPPKKWGPVCILTKKKKNQIPKKQSLLFYMTLLPFLVHICQWLPFSSFFSFLVFLPTYPFPWISSYLWSTYNIFIFVSNETFFQQSLVVVVVLRGWSGFREEERRNCCHFFKSSFFFFMSLKFLLYLKQSLECFYDYPGLQF